MDIVVITGRFTLADGTTPAKGTVVFQLSSPLQDSAGNVIATTKEITKPLIDGVLTVSLVATNSPGLDPSGTTYTVTERFAPNWTRSYRIEVPYDSEGGTLDLADVAPVEDSTITYGVTLQAFDAHTALTSGVHGIADTTALETTTGAQAKADAAQAAAASGLAAHEADTTGVHGIADTAQLETTTGAQAKVNAHKAQLPVNVLDHGAVGDGVTDNTTAINNALQAAYDAGGGTIVFPAGTYRIDSVITLPHNGDATRASQPPIRLLGVGSDWSGIPSSTSWQQGGSILDFRATSGAAKFITIGAGMLACEHLTFADLGSSSIPYLLAINTTLHITECAFMGNTSKAGRTCDQDAIILGGTQSASGNTTDSPFGGYGTVISRTRFDRIRRVVYCRARANANVIRDCHVGINCGAADGTAAVFEVDSFLTEAAANIFDGNVIEGTYYTYVWRIKDATNTMCIGNQVWDPAPSLIAFRLEGAASSAADGTIVFGLYWPLSRAQLYSDGGTNNTPQIYHATGAIGEFRSLTASNIFQPLTATGSENTKLLEIYRAADEATNPSGEVFYVRQDGLIRGTGSGAGLSFPLGSLLGGGADIVLSRNSSGKISISPGSGGQVHVTTGVFRLPSYTIAARPSATTFVGQVIYDSTLGLPIFSDGTAWKKFDGTAA